jgi:hypothetical protein
VNRFGLSRSGDDAVSHRNVTGAARPTLPEEQQDVPRAGDTLFEIGVIITLHLAFALVVLVTLDAFGVR